MTHAPTVPDDVAQALAEYSPEIRQKLLVLREMIYATAGETDGVGQVVERLKWGQPSYDTVAPRSGTPLRIGLVKSGDVALFAHCQTRVMREAQDIFADVFSFEGNRALVLPNAAGWPEVALRQVIRSALTYRLSTPA